MSSDHSDPTPSDPTPSEPTPSEPTPSEPTPSEPTPSEPTPLLDWIDLHVLYLSVLSIAIGFNMVGEFASRPEPAELKTGLVAAAIAFAVGAPAALFLFQLIGNRRRFQPGERRQYMLVNGAVLALGAVLLVGRAWATWF